MDFDEQEYLSRFEFFPGHEDFEGYELLQGMHVQRPPATYRHARAITQLFAAFSPFFGFPLLLSNLSIHIDEENAPRPDFIVLSTPAPKRTEKQIVRVSDVQLVIEVADVTLTHDSHRKMLHYGRAGIPEYWLIDVLGQGVLIHRQPTQTGYASLTEHYNLSEIVSPLGMPDAKITVGDLLML